MDSHVSQKSLKALAYDIKRRKEIYIKNLKIRESITCKAEMKLKLKCWIKEKIKVCV